MEINTPDSSSNVLMERVKALLRYDNRYLSFACGLCLMTAAGTEYMFSTYAPDLKDLMGYTQTEINFVGNCTNLGIYLGFYMGILYDFTSARIISFIGSIFLFLGWYLSYLGTMGYFPTNYILMGFFMFLGGNGANGLYTAAIGNNIKKFPPKYRGTIVGLLVSMFGLSSAIFSPIYAHVFDSDVQSFLLFFSILMPIIGLTGVIFLAPPKETPILKEVEIDNETIVEEVIPLSLMIKEEVNSIKLFTKIDFWLLFSVFMLGAGVGLTIINNLGSMAESVGGKSASSLVTFLSIFNCLGRIVFGILSDIALKYKIMSRTSVLCIAMVMMAASQVYFVCVLSLDSAPALYPGVAILGATYGGLMSLSPSITTELFGQKYFGGNWSIIRISPAFSSFVMSTLLAGVLYQRNITGDGNDCYGWACYGWSISIDFFICLIAVFLCVVLSLRWFMYARKQRKQGAKLLSKSEI